MSADKFQNQTPAYTFLGNSPGDEFREIARVYHIEAKHLMERARAAEAEERPEEAKLLMDLAASQEERAQEYERAARGEGDDPIVTEILDQQQELCDNYTPYVSTYKPENVSEAPPEKKKLSLSGRLVRAVAWVGSLVS